MPTYNVELRLRHPSYTIEADSEEDAIRLAQYKYLDEADDLIADIETCIVNEKLEEDWN